MKRRTKIILGSGTGLIALAILASTQVTLFVIQPIGALPEGRTVVLTRLTNMRFIDSPDAVCERIQGGVSLLCRGAVMARVVGEAKILMRLPYSETLYSISTDGRSYEN